VAYGAAQLKLAVERGVNVVEDDDVAPTNGIERPPKREALQEREVGHSLDLSVPAVRRSSKTDAGSGNQELPRRVFDEFARRSHERLLKLLSRGRCFEFDALVDFELLAKKS